jgi:lysophospholipid acyltransferase (LPLAT)-like uncharacterized protein
MKNFLIVNFVTLYIRFIAWTSKFTHIVEETLPEKSLIYIFWHRRLMMLPYAFKDSGVYILVSTSKDGDISAGVNRKFGFNIIRGTASKPKEARRSIIKMIRTLKEGNDIAITPDGPKGPALKVKKGIPYMAQKTGAPIVPLVYSVKKKKILKKSWDKFILPFPFNKVVVITGKPMYIKPEDNLESYVQIIEDKLNEYSKKADKIVEEM